MDYVIDRPVVWREAKLKSGKAQQFKGYRARERKERLDMLAEKKRIAAELRRKRHSALGERKELPFVFRYKFIS